MIERSWLPYDSNTDFPLQNIPFGVARYGNKSLVVSRIGDWLINLSELAEESWIPQMPGLQDGILWPECEILRDVRNELQNLLREENRDLRDHALTKTAIFPCSDKIHMELPIVPNAYVDFYSGIHHATNVGKMFRPDMPPLLPNYRHLPVAYNGRANTVNVYNSIARPSGQTKANDETFPKFGPTKELDFELELGFYLGKESRPGVSIPIQEAERYILGFVLVNDWSARDVQRWEYQPLGPFLAKSFATGVSPWLVLLDALEPFRCQGQVQDPSPLPYLQQIGGGHFNIELQVKLQTSGSHSPQLISQTNTRELYWTPAQQLAHQSSNGTKVEGSDLYASGTISSEKPHPDGLGAFGSMLELTWRGQNPLTILETDEERKFLEDGDTVTFTGFGQGDGFRVGFGEISTTIRPASS